MAWCCILLCAVASLVSLLVKALILIRSQRPELFCHTEDYQDSPPWPQKRKTFPSPVLLLIPGTMAQLGHLCHAPKPNNWSLVPGVALVSFSLSSPYCHGLFLYMARGKELYLSHNLLLYRSAALLTVYSICVHKHLICQHCLQKSQAFWTSTLHTALITAPVISSARS